MFGVVSLEVCANCAPLAMGGFGRFLGHSRHDVRGAAGFDFFHDHPRGADGSFREEIVGLILISKERGCDLDNRPGAEVVTVLYTCYGNSIVGIYQP